ncbi:MAG: glycosyltransferase family 39 protein [Spirochaetales bacterium]|nr:glycosyltransferase family 39 protein [Spirochaetales bacterium]
MILPILALLLIAAWRLHYALGLPVVPDEAYYWAWSRQLDLSYYDQGPGIAYYIRIFTELFGHTQLALKLAAIFAATLATLFMLFTVRLISRERWSLYGVLLLMTLIPGFFGGSVVIMHDSLLLLAWCGAIFSGVHFLLNRSVAGLTGLFLATGVGLSAKHTMVFLALAWTVLLLYQRGALLDFLKRPLTYSGLTISLLFLLPVLIWNIKHDWASIEAIAHLRSSGGRFAEGAVGEYLGGQLLMFSPGFVLALAAVTLRLKNGRWKRYLSRDLYPGGDESGRRILALQFIALTALLPVVFFFIMSFTRTVQPNWVFPAYPGAILLLAVYRPEGLGLRIHKILLVFGFLFAIAFAVVMLFAQSIENLAGRRINSYYIPALRYAGYKEAILEIESERLKKNPEAVLAANRYQDAAIASWYLPDKRYVPSLNIMQKNQYSYWPGLRPGQDALIFAIQENTCEKATIFFSPLLEDIFEKSDIFEYKEKDVLFADRVAKRYQLYYAENYEQSWDHLLYNYIVKKAIQDFMPTLKDDQNFSDATSGAAQARIARSITELFLSRKGKVKCDLFE